MRVTNFQFSFLGNEASCEQILLCIFFSFLHLHYFRFHVLFD